MLVGLIMLEKHRGTSVLIVEDSATQADQLRYFLEKHGFTVTVASNGREALSSLQHHLPTVVISDIVMPHVNGYELCTAIRSDPRTAHLPVVLLTALSSPRDILLALECKADHFITKPYSEVYLLSRMESILEMIHLRQNGQLPEISESDIYFQGEWFQISTDRQRILDLLISTYESMVSRNQEMLITQNELRESNLKLELAVDEATTAKQQAHLMLDELSMRDRAIGKTNEELQLIHNIESLINQNNDLQSLFRLVSEKLCNARQFGIRDFVRISLAELDNTAADGTVCLQDICCHRCELTSAVFEHAGPVSMSCHPTGAKAGKMTIPLLAKNKIVGALCCQIETDYQLSEQQRELLSSLGRQLGMALENIRLYEEARALSLHDPLTGLANRRYLDISYANQVAQSKRHSQPFSLMLLDIDHFKLYNDNHGHSQGDRILIQVADILRNSTRSTDLAVRYGGEEFLLLISESNAKAAFELAERIRLQVIGEIGITISIGVTDNRLTDTLATQIIRADTALYKAKHEGRNQVKIE
jgi:diguanylate cyclase (GGDEF)-like protein